MGKRAQSKRAKNEIVTQKQSMVRHILSWEQFGHPHFWIGVVAFVLVVSYPFALNSHWYKQHVAHQNAEDIVATTANEATITTDKGQITFAFDRADAPRTVENFSLLATRGYYNNLTFHRVEPGFVIQGGDPKGDGTGGTSAFGSTFNDEINPTSPLYMKGYVEGVVAMANSGPNTNGSQFFMMLADHLDLPANYTIFGHVTSGMDVVKQIVKGDKMLKVEVR